MQKKKFRKPKMTAEEREALMKVRNMLDTGIIRHVKRWEALPEKARDIFAIGLKMLFNMRIPAKTTECGTVGCIGGWMGAMMGMSPHDADYFVKREVRFKPLFYPPDKREWDAITPAIAVKAIDGFMKDGNPRWDRMIPMK